jgi:hypothetical protein
MAELLEMSPAGVAGGLEAMVRHLLVDAYGDYPFGSSDLYAHFGTPHLIMLLREQGAGEGQLIGHLAAYRREIAIGGDSVEIGMIGSVAIAADHRRKGHCQALVRQAHLRFGKSALPFCLLFALEPRVYASSGYRPMENTTRFRESDGAWKTFVYRGGMYAELAQRRWPNLPIDLRGPAV